MRVAALLAISALGCSAPSPRLDRHEQALSTGVVISAVYGGSIASGSYTKDFVELFNRGSTPVVVTGMSLQYSRTDYRTWSANVVPLNGTIPPGGYYLVEYAGNQMALMDLPTPDATGATNIATMGGLFALVNGTTPLDCGPPFAEDGGASPDAAAVTACTSTSIVDFVGQGLPGASPAPAPVYEGSAAAPNGNVTSVVRRKDDGCMETDDNATDFERVEFGATVVPRNSMSPTHLCTPASEAGVDATEDAESDADGDAGIELDDAATTSDSASDAAGSTPLPSEGRTANGGGCGCRMEGPSGASFSASWALALAFIVRRRRLARPGYGCPSTRSWNRK